jgi:uncharacterized protein (DUF433 family)
MTRRHATNGLYEGTSPLHVAAYSVGEAAHHLQLPAATVRSWVLGRGYATTTGARRFQPLIRIADRRLARLSFQNLVEVHVLAALRREHLVKVPAVRKALRYLEREFDTRHPLSDVQMQTDGTDVFVERYGKLINASREGQIGIREALEAHLQRIERDPRGVPIKLYPFTTSRRDDDADKPIVIDPRLQFGKPCVAGTGIPTGILVDRFKAGEPISDLAKDYGLAGAVIESAIRYETQRAA